jgi:uncharacterized membrane protein YcaP (DUF421 family)
MICDQIVTCQPSRRQNVAKIDDVQWAVMVTSGAISFIEKPDA